MGLIDVMNSELLQELGDGYFENDPDWGAVQNDLEKMRNFLCHALEIGSLLPMDVRLLVGDELADKYSLEAQDESLVETEHVVAYRIQTRITLPSKEKDALVVLHLYDGNEFFIKHNANTVFPEPDTALANVYYQERKITPPIQQTLKTIYEVMKASQWTFEYEHYEARWDGYYEVVMRINGHSFRLTVNPYRIIFMRLVRCRFRVEMSSTLEHQIMTFIQTKSPLRMEFLYD